MHARSLLNRLLDGSHRLEGAQIPRRAVLQTCLLSRSERIVAEIIHAIREAVLNRGELHSHLHARHRLLHHLILHLDKDQK